MKSPPWQSSPILWVGAGVAGFLATLLLTRRASDPGDSPWPSWPSGPQSLRDKILEQARAAIDLSADPAGGTRDAYLALIAPGETETQQASMAKMSGCALTIAGFWRGAGIQDEKLDPPYKVGTAVSRLHQIAVSRGAWVPYESGALPSPGDMVLIGDNAGGGVEHVFTVVDAPSADAIQSIDGGQVDSNGFQVVRAKQRSWASGKDVAKLANDPGGSFGAARVIKGWVDVSRLEEGIA